MDRSGTRNVIRSIPTGIRKIAYKHVGNITTKKSPAAQRATGPSILWLHTVPVSANPLAQGPAALRACSMGRMSSATLRNN